MLHLPCQERFCVFFGDGVWDIMLFGRTNLRVILWPSSTMLCLCGNAESTLDAPRTGFLWVCACLLVHTARQFECGA